MIYTLVSDTTYSSRHSLRVNWSKVQDDVESVPLEDIESTFSPKSQTFTMLSISTPDAKQSEAYIATTALFVIFGSSTREEKVYLRLPAQWRDLWIEMADLKKKRLDAADRASVRTFRDMVRAKKDQEMEDGVLIQGAFRNRAANRAPDGSDDSSLEKTTRSSLTPQTYQNIWLEKSSSPNYQKMLVSASYSADLGQTDLS